MVNCPNCGKELGKSARKIETILFRVELYTCGFCGEQFKVVNQGL